MPAAASVLAFAATAIAQDTGETFAPTSVWLPEPASTYAPALDGLFDFIFWLTVIVNIAVFVCMAVFLWMYRAKPNRRATFIHGNHKLEMVWTLIPALMLVMITTFSQSTWSNIKTPFTPPSVEQVKSHEVVEMGVVGRQFAWYFHYPGADGVLGPISADLIPQSPQDDAERIGLDKSDPASADDFVTTIGVVPVNKRIYIHLDSLDVLHSFYLPNFRVKQDAVPGLNGRVWLEATRTSADVVGRNPDAPLRLLDNSTYEFVEITDAKPFDLVCAELCGQGHFKMRGAFYVVEDDEYQKFLTVNAPAAESDQADDGGYGY